MSRPTTIIALVFAVSLAGCTVPLGSGTRDLASPPEDPAALDGRLSRCAALGGKASSDADCQSAWAEARRRILPLSPAEK